MTITRRLFLQNTAAASMATAAPASAEFRDQYARARETQSPRDRLMAAIAEVQATSAELWPDIDHWRISVAVDDKPTNDVPVFLVAFRPNPPRQVAANRLRRAAS